MKCQYLISHEVLNLSPTLLQFRPGVNAPSWMADEMMRLGRERMGGRFQLSFVFANAESGTANLLGKFEGDEVRFIHVRE